MIDVRTMTFADLPLGLRLRQQAGWNQTPADWARFLSLAPDGCFVALHDKEPVGTATTCVLGSVAWIGMMLVEPAFRGRGIGRALMEHALKHLEARNVRTVRLDATPQGEPLYRKLGFQDQFTLGRFGGEPDGLGSATTVEPGTRKDWHSAAELDQLVTRTERKTLLFELFRERPTELRVIRRGGAVVGYMTVRRGARAWQLGPCCATAEAGPLLLADAFHRFAGRSCFIDIPHAHDQAIALARRHGFLEQRTLLRMYRGENVHEILPQLWASSGPEKG